MCCRLVCTIPEVVKYYGFFDNPHGIILKSYDNNLHDYIMLDSRNQEELSLDHQFSFAIDIAKAIDHIHNQDVVHFDIKPLNILLEKDNVSSLYRCVVTDFGVSYTRQSQIKKPLI